MKIPTTRQVWTSVGALAVIGGLIGAGWVLDEHWTPREIHEFTIDQVYADMGQFQKDLRVQRAQDNIIYWQRIELQMQDACDRYPNDRNLRRKYERAKRERQEAERRLRELGAR